MGFGLMKREEDFALLKKGHHSNMSKTGQQYQHYSTFLGGAVNDTVQKRLMRKKYIYIYYMSTLLSNNKKLKMQMLVLSTSTIIHFSQT